MKHATSRFLFAYWDGLRGEHAAPDRREIEPARIRHILADTFILAADAAPAGIFRLAGTRCCALFGRELRADPFPSLWGDPANDDASRFVSIVREQGAGVVFGALATNAAGAAVPVEILLLPLRHGGRGHVRILGSVATASPPAWAGFEPVRRLETTAMRVIAAGRAPVAPSGTPPPGRRPGPTLTLLPGGRSPEGGRGPEQGQGQGSEQGSEGGSGQDASTPR